MGKFESEGEGEPIHSSESDKGSYNTAAATSPCIVTTAAQLSTGENNHSDYKDPSSKNKRCSVLRQFFRTRLGKTILLYVLLAVLSILIWGTLLSLTGSSSLPGGLLFALFFLPIFSWIGGQMMTLIHLPPLLGMLIVGFCLRNIPYIDFAKAIEPAWSLAFRNVALAVILTRAGMGLDVEKLKKLSVTCAKLSLIPCMTEGAVAAIATYILLGFPWLWCFIMGFVIASVSPAVVVPSMLNLQERGYGVAKGIPTLLIASGSVDNVAAITAFGIVLSITFSSKSLALTILQGPLEVIIGILYGFVLGGIAWYLGKKIEGMSLLLRSVLLLFSSMFAIFGGRLIGYAGAGPLGCLTASFIAGYGWSKTGLNKDVAQVFNIIWIIFQPILFGLIGSEVTVSSLDVNTVGLGIATVLIAVTYRTICTFVIMLRGSFSLKEELFIAIAWIPKATVQAAIGPIAMDTAIQLNAGADDVNMGRQILTIAVLAILITAPIGAIGISLMGPRLLQRESSEQESVPLP